MKTTTHQRITIEFFFFRCMFRLGKLSFVFMSPSDASCLSCVSHKTCLVTGPQGSRCLCGGWILTERKIAEETKERPEPCVQQTIFFRLGQAVGTKSRNSKAVSMQLIVHVHSRTIDTNPIQAIYGFSSSVY